MKKLVLLWVIWGSIGYGTENKDPYVEYSICLDAVYDLQSKVKIESPVQIVKVGKVEPIYELNKSGIFRRYDLDKKKQINTPVSSLIQYTDGIYVSEKVVGENGLNEIMAMLDAKSFSDLQKMGVRAVALERYKNTFSAGIIEILESSLKNIKEQIATGLIIKSRPDAENWGKLASRIEDSCSANKTFEKSLIEKSKEFKQVVFAGITSKYETYKGPSTSPKAAPGSN